MQICQQTDQIAAFISISWQLKEFTELNTQIFALSCLMGGVYDDVSINNLDLYM